MNKPSGQNRQTNSLKECVFANSALKMQCHAVKNTKISLKVSEKIIRKFTFSPRFKNKKNMK